MFFYYFFSLEKCSKFFFLIDRLVSVFEISEKFGGKKFYLCNGDFLIFMLVYSRLNLYVNR